MCLLTLAGPRDPVTITPPLLCVEILSPEDRLPRVAARMQDFLTMGVLNIWVIDPAQRLAYTYTAAGLQPHSESILTIAAHLFFSACRRFSAPSTDSTSLAG